MINFDKINGVSENFERQVKFKSPDVSRNLSITSLLLIFALVFINASLSYSTNGQSEDNTSLQLLFLLIFCLAWFGLVGLRLSSAIFASVALIPSVLVGGYGIVFFSFGALSLSNLMMLIALFIWLFTNYKLQWRGYSIMLLTISVTCAISVILSSYSGFFGEILRLIMSTMFVWIIFSASNDHIRRAYVDGVLVWPITVLAYMGGIGHLSSFFGLALGNSLSGIESDTVIYSSHEVIQYLYPIIPLAIVYGFKRFNPILLAILLFMTVMSNSRSLVVAVFFIAIVLFVNKIRVQKINFLTLIYLILFLCIGIGLIQAGAFNLTSQTEKQESNVIRLIKMANAFDSFVNNPLFGVGYGAANVVDSKIIKSSDSANALQTAISESTASPEFTPLQILAESGMIGALFMLWLIYYSGLRFLRLQKMPSVPRYINITLYCWAIHFFTIFLGSNSYSSMIIELAFPVAAYEIYYRRHLDCVT